MLVKMPFRTYMLAGVVIVAVVAGCVFNEQYPANVIQVPPLTPETLSTIRALCGYYYKWREDQPRTDYVTKLDQTCFDAQVDMP